MLLDKYPDLKGFFNCDLLYRVELSHNELKQAARRYKNNEPNWIPGSIRDAS
jgi:hypothetical protein